VVRRGSTALGEDRSSLSQQNPRRYKACGWREGGEHHADVFLCVVFGREPLPPQCLSLVGHCAMGAFVDGQIEPPPGMSYARHIVCDGTRKVTTRPCPGSWGCDLAVHGYPEPGDQAGHSWWLNLAEAEL